MANFRTHYDNLKVARNAPDSVIKAAYNALIQQYHPDKFEDLQEEVLRISKLITHSYEVLSDPVRRATHDLWIKEQEAELEPNSGKAQFSETGQATEQTYHQKPEYTPPLRPPKQAKPSKTRTPVYAWRRYFDYMISVMLIRLGFANAQYNLGVMYDNGRGVPQDDQQALYWYRKAAEQGVAEAQYNLGFMYKNGQGVPQSYQQAIYWYQKAADQGYALAQYNLGGMYYDGNGFPQNYQQAIYWYQKAAEQGFANAQYNLGVMYYNGNGFPQSYQQAIYWYQKAAEQGDADAQNNLGIMYYDGNGFPQNYQQAIYWYQKAAEQGNADAQDNLDKLRAQMR